MKPWSSRGIEGVSRFLMRVWRFFIEDEGGFKPGLLEKGGLPAEMVKILHQTTKKVTHDIENMSFNTAISQMMVFMNQAYQMPELNAEACETFIKLLYPFAPHIAEELWFLMGHTQTIAYELWPTYNDELTKENEFEMVIQINGKIRSKQMVSADISEDEMKTVSLADEKIKGYLEGNEVKKIIVVKKKLVNIIL
jgi:leucyl-tRNA synthetase